MRKARPMMAVVLALLGAAMLGRAEEGPIVITHREQYPLFPFDPIHGSLGVTGLYQNNNTRVSGQSSSATDTLFTQDLTLGTGGAIVSRNLFNWSATGTASLAEEQSTGVQQGQSQFAFFDAYDLEAGILSASEIPSTLFARRSENYVNRAFASTLRNTDTSYGATVQYNNGPTTSMLSVSHSTNEQSNVNGSGRITVEQNQLQFTTSFQPAERHNLTLNYSYTGVEQNNPGIISNGYNLSAASATHYWNIDPAGHYVLAQYLSYSQQNGTFANERLHVDNQLRMRFLENLDGGVNYALDRQQFTNSLTTTQTASASLTHRLYESLSTTGRVATSLVDNSYSGGDSSSRTNAASIATNYTKKVYMGRFGAHLSLGYSQTDNSAIGQSQQVLNDPQTFALGQPIILTRAGIDPSTIHVFQGTTELALGTAYTVTPVGNTIRIQPVLGGGIDPNLDVPVLLNYRINPLPGYSSASTSLGAGTQYSFDDGPFKGLSLFLRYYQVDQTISPSSASIRPDNIRDTTIGADYRVWKLTLHAESETRDSTLAPYDAIRLSARYSNRLNDRTTLDVDVTQDFLRFPQQDSRTSFTTVDGRLQYDIARDLRGILTVRWRDENESQTGSTMGFEEDAELHWKIRQTNLFLLLRHTSLDSFNGDSNTFLAQFGISRMF